MNRILSKMSLKKSGRVSELFDDIHCTSSNDSDQRADFVSDGYAHSYPLFIYNNSDLPFSTRFFNYFNSKSVYLFC